MSSSCAVAAVDLGASSGRVLVGRFGAGEATLEEAHRFPNEAVQPNGRLEWDAPALFEGVLAGLRRAEQLAGPLDSVGVDCWAVDYGLLDAQGDLIANPVHYRDGRTAPIVAQVLSQLGPQHLYSATGIQLQPFNTMFQLLAEGASLARASSALLMPDLISYWLCGERGTEVTNASTTALLDPRTLDWSTELAERLRIPVGLFPALRRPATVLGRVRADVVAAAGLANAPLVVTVPSHDTAAAVAGTPADSDAFAFVCTGTWALVGVELTAPMINEAARLANFTNEVGADDTIRFLRNVTGFWLLQECVREWQSAGEVVDLAALTAAAAGEPGLRLVIDVQDPAFVPPGGMPDRIRAAAAVEGEVSRAGVARCILDSVALAVRNAVRDAARLSGRQVEIVHVVGGGVANELFCQLVADACEVPVSAGPVEAASWGNAVSQAQALGVVPAGLAAGRALVRQCVRPREYRPRAQRAAWDEAAAVLVRRAR